MSMRCCATGIQVTAVAIGKGNRVPAYNYRGQRERVLDALSRKFQLTSDLCAATGLERHQIAVALMRLRKEGLAESRTIKPKDGGYHIREHRLVGKKPVAVKAPVKTERSEYWQNRTRSAPAPVRAHSDNERVLKSLGEDAVSSQSLSKRLKLTVAQVRNAVSYLKTRGYDIDVTYVPAESGQPLAHYKLNDDSAKAANKRKPQAA
jgi:biotin operon repressor